MARNPYDGRPFYCTTCGLGFGEFMACELPDCELETREAAQARARAAKPPSAASIRVDRRPPACPAARGEIHAAAVAAMKAREP